MTEFTENAIAAINLSVAAKAHRETAALISDALKEGAWLQANGSTGNGEISGVFTANGDHFLAIVGSDFDFSVSRLVGVQDIESSHAD